MPRTEHHGDPEAPAATIVSPVVVGIVRDTIDRILLVRRIDDGNWEPPGGRVDPGESATAALIREVSEESAVLVTISSVAGVYCDPDHVIVHPATGEVRQPFAVYFHARAVDGQPRSDGHETSAAAWHEPEQLDALPMRAHIRLRLEQILRQPEVAHVD